jgi:hypothetical protein
MQFLQSETAGTYTSRFRNRATGETWQPWQNPNVPAVGAPARITKESLKAGGKREEVHRDVQVPTPRDRSRRDLDRGR